MSAFSKSKIRKSKKATTGKDVIMISRKTQRDVFFEKYKDVLSGRIDNDKEGLFKAYMEQAYLDLNKLYPDCIIRIVEDDIYTISAVTGTTVYYVEVA